ncbi:trypsin-like serine protease [Piscinibacter sakaiensis]|uniref:Trypsin-like serine protease n=1 Tax=Piscinibacter sakaiensis TaxID=1547922 RepID=A0A0K8P263_PISS1|nr:trypsin-like serine protease [Piscinibacter sakaiensis]
MRRPLPRGAVAAAAVLALWAAGARAQDEDEFERRAVRIGCFVDDGNGRSKLAGTGSGFLVGDRRHVVTNHHVAMAEACQRGTAAVLVGKTPVRLKVLTWSEQHDLAVAVAEHDIPGKEPVPAIVRAADIASRDEVYVLGFPGIVDEMAADDNMLRPTTTRGIVGRKIETASRTGMLQVDARTIGGNSGGPWVDPCGRLVGIHSRASYQFVETGNQLQRLPVGYGYAVQTDHLIPLLDQARVRYDVAGRCTFLVRNGRTLAWSAAALLGGALAFGYSPPGQRLWNALAGRMAAPGGGAAAVPAGPHLAGLSGPLRGVSVDLAKGPIAIGRDPRVSHLALPAGCDDVSKRHCLVRLAPDGRHFLLEDCWSTNGTFLASGERLAPGSTREVPPGTRFYLSDASQMFELRGGGT